MAGNEDLLKEILASQKKSSKEAKEEFTALKSGQQNITRELAEVRKDVDFLQKRNDDIEKRLTALEEAGSSARNSNTYQWRQAVKYAKKVVVLNLPKGEKLPEDDKGEVRGGNLQEYGNEQEGYRQVQGDEHLPDRQQESKQQC